MSTGNSNPEDDTPNSGPVCTENDSSTHLLTVLIIHLIADILQCTGSANILDKEPDPVFVTMELGRGERSESVKRPLTPAEPGLLLNLPSHPSWLHHPLLHPLR